MQYNFDKIINRKNTNSLKYDFSIERVHRDDLLPLWIADMDFRLPDVILDDINKAVTHGIFGYSDSKEEYFNALHNWFFNHFNWSPESKWLIKTPGIVFAIAIAIRTFTNPGDAVLLQQPVYYPFSECIVDNRRRLINNQLVYSDGKYSIDFEDFEKKIVEEKIKLFLLCSPHNPVGRVWTVDELTRIGEICLKHNVLVVSDEIHCDFTYPNHPHTVFASISETFAMNSIICTAPSKTFNMAGLQLSNIFIPNSKIRSAFKKEFKASGYSQVGALGIVGCQSAYKNGYEWHNELKAYLKRNLDFVRDYLKTYIPEIRLVEPEGTYLIWLDCQGLNLNHRELSSLVIDKAKLWLDDGIIFGKETSQFERINIACPRNILELALVQLHDAVKEIRH